MLATVPSIPQTETHQERFDASFRPGDLSQDIYTIPLEIGLIASLTHFYNPRSKTLFPGVDQATSESNDATTYTRSALLPYVIGTGTLVFAGLSLCDNNDNFHFWTQIRGFAHALLLSEVAASSAKVIFQEKRPSYDAQTRGHHGEETDDSRASFYSDHANQAFAFTTYTSLLIFKFSNSIAVSTVYTAAAVTAASIVSYSRVPDHAHNLSDVVVGAIMGSTISGLTFFRVQEIDARVHEHPAAHSSVNWDIMPGMIHDSTGKAWYTADINMEI